MSNFQTNIKMDVRDNNQLVKVEEFNNIMRSAPAVLQRNQTSVSACNQAGQALLDTIEAAGGINTDELDTAVAEYLAKTKITVDNMNKRRKALTQLLSNVSKSFTTLEAAIDVKSPVTIPYRLQQARNKYAAKKLEEQRRREEEARRAQMVENEKAQYRSDISLLLERAYGDYVSRHISYLNGVMNRATLSTYDESVRLIKEASTDFSWSDFVKGVNDTFTTCHITAETRKSIKNEVASQKKVEFARRYAFEMDELRQSLIDRLPSLRKQLEEQEALRRTNEAEAKRMEEERQRKEAEAQEAERKRKEEEERKKSEAARQQIEMGSLFNAEAAVPGYQPKMKVSKKIELLNPEGILPIIGMWWRLEGCNLSVEELSKMFKKQITFCEKVANKDGEFIKDESVNYIDDVKAK